MVEPPALRGAIRGRWARRVVTVLGLLALSVVATWPLVLHLDEFLSVSDPMVSAWDLWWVAHSLAHFDNPYWSTALFAPDGTYLSFHALVPLAGLVAAPVTWLFGAAVSVNILKLVLPVVAALTGRSLSRQLGLRPGPALVAGCLYGFSTIVVWRTTFHMNFGMGLAVLPLPLTYVARYASTGSVRSALAAGAAFALVLYADPTMAFFALVAAGVYVLCAARTSLSLRLWVVGVAQMAGVAIAFSLPQLVMMWRASTNGGYESNPMALAGSWIPGSTSLSTMVSPGNVRVGVPGTLESLAYRHPWGEATPTYGWAVLALAFIALVAVVIKRKPATVPGATVAWGTALTLLATVLALGPVLRIATVNHVPFPIELDGQTLSALMPYTWLSQLPMFGDVRIPARFTMLGILPLSVLAGLGVQILWSWRRFGQAVVVLVLGFALLESGFPDGGSGKLWVPLDEPEVTHPIAQDKSSSVVMDVPLGFISGTAGAGTGHEQIGMLRATEHHHPISGGYVSRMSQPQVDTLLKHRLYNDVIALQPDIPGAGDPAVDPAVGAADATASNIRWAIVRPEASRRVVRYLESAGFRTVVRTQGGTLLLHR